jgi:hypothetical protein
VVRRRRRECLIYLEGVSMLRSLICSLTILGLCASVTLADDAKKDKTEPAKQDKSKPGKKPSTQAKITKIDPKAHTVTVKMKDKTGKSTEKTFKLTEEVRYMDSTGRVVAADFFRNGNQVLVIEEEGQLKEMKQAKPHKKTGDTQPTSKK